MKRAAIYSRFSSDLQTDRSIEDQVALCRAKAKRDGFDVVAEYDDRAKSGASIIGRTGIARMLDDARAGLFDVLLVEELDRLSRDQEDLAFVFKRLKHRSIPIVTAHGGPTDEIQIGVRGIVSALYLTDLAHKTRRGQAGNIRAGKHAGGLAYGYKLKAGAPGEWEIDEGEAAIVRRIFASYVAGVGPKAICMELIAEGVKPPRKAPYWLPNTLLGSRKRQNGILANETYVGRLVWNRTRFVKDPDTGKRISRLNPESEWHRADVPHLAIIDPKTFAVVAAKRSMRAAEKNPRLRRPKSPLSGLLKCGVCGGSLTIRGTTVSGTWVRCSNFHKAATCTNRQTYLLHEIERTILDGLRRELADPAGIELFIAEYQAERARLARAGTKARSDLERQLAIATRRFDRAFTEALDSELPMATFRPKLAALEADKAALAAKLASMEQPSNVVSLHPAALARYRAILDSLAAETTGDAEATDALRSLIARASVRPTAAGEPLVIDVEGQLAALLGVSVFPTGTVGGEQVVAGMRNHLFPTYSMTFGLAA